MIPLPCPAKTPPGRAAAEHGKLAFFVLKKIFCFFVKKACILLKGMVIYFLRNGSHKTKYPGVAKFGIALEWGSRGRWFESSHSDHRSVLRDTPIFYCQFVNFSCYCTGMCNFRCSGTCMQQDLFLTTYRRAIYDRRKLQLPNQPDTAS